MNSHRLVGVPGFEARLRFGRLVWSGVPHLSFRKPFVKPETKPKKPQRRRAKQKSDPEQRRMLLEVYGQSVEAGASVGAAIGEANALVALALKNRLGAPEGTGPGEDSPGRCVLGSAKGVEPECSVTGDGEAQERSCTVMVGLGLPKAQVGTATGYRRSHAEETRPIVGPYASPGRGLRTGLGPEPKQHATSTRSEPGPVSDEGSPGSSLLR